ncbi:MULTISPECIES: hypothetical protein [Streptomyces]|uniref:hypothetical protein n=1 Tax=Streptomyces TaxID=1883 RepID=UPI000A68E79B|nr:MULTISPECIES: hypothetical protein [Streptomyces]
MGKGSESPKSDLGALNADDQDLYKSLAAGEEVPAGADLSRLAALGLVDESPYVAGAWLAMDPRAAIQRTLEAEHARLTASLQRLADIPVLEGLTPSYERTRRFDSMGSEFLATKALMNERIGAVTGKAAVELLAAQPVLPAHRDPATHKLGTDRSLAALERGATLRLIYRATAATDPATQEYASALIEAGGEVRAATGPFPRMIIIDRRSLFIDDLVTRPERAETHSGWHVADRSSVMWAKHVFDLYWEMALPWAQAVAAAGEVVLTERQLDILEQLNAGRSQEGAARALNVSGRWVIKELAAARERLGLGTTFQLMAWYGRWLERSTPPA